MALLSCAKRVHVASKTKKTQLVGGVIDNSSLDKAITDDLNSQEYKLEELTSKVSTSADIKEQGTYIYFENVNEGIANTLDYIKISCIIF